MSDVVCTHSFGANSCLEISNFADVLECVWEFRQDSLAGRSARPHSISSDCKFVVEPFPHPVPRSRTSTTHHGSVSQRHWQRRGQNSFGTSVERDAMRCNVVRYAIECSTHTEKSSTVHIWRQYSISRDGRGTQGTCIQWKRSKVMIPPYRIASPHCAALSKTATSSAARKSTRGRTFANCLPDAHTARPTRSHVVPSRPLVCAYLPNGH